MKLFCGVRRYVALKCYIINGHDQAPFRRSGYLSGAPLLRGRLRREV